MSLTRGTGIITAKEVALTQSPKAFQPGKHVKKTKLAITDVQCLIDLYLKNEGTEEDIYAVNTLTGATFVLRLIGKTASFQGKNPIY